MLPAPACRAAALTAAIAALGASTLLPIGTAGAGTAAPTPVVAWRGCGGEFECTSVEVPVDHASPDGEQVPISLVRLPATDAATRLGSLVVNFGGPGDPATETMREAAAGFSPEIRARFDLVAFDPRGTGASRAVDCVDDATFDRLWSEDATPDAPEELPAFYDGTNASVDFTQACIDTQGDWLRRVGTRNVARDLDLIRRAIGDRRLTFLGYSYGTVLGAVYAELFPRRIRAMVLDGAVNLSSDAAQEQRANLVGFERALDAFLAECTADTGCTFHSGGDPRTALAALRDRFEQGLVLDGADGRTAGVTELYTTLLAALYQRSAWPILADALAAASDGDGSYLREITDLFTGRRADGTYNNYQEAIGAISCADRFDARPTFEEYRATLDESRLEFPFFGPVLAAYPVGCDPRLPRAPDAEQLGDVRSRRAPPILVIGTTEDPATPYAGAQDLVRRLRGARLLTLEATEHSSYGRGIACIDGAVDRYLVDRTLPPRGTRCTA